MNNRNEGKKEWENLGISNDFLFGKVMTDPELCKELLEIILPELEIDHIEYPELQKGIQLDMDAKSVRLDVYIKDEKETIYDIEMQTTDTKELPKRSRYYQSMIDLQMIDKGESYKKLKKSYVIFICLTDVFHEGRHKYTFENRCREDGRIALKDGASKIFLNADGKISDVSRELKAFLDYVAGRESEDSFVKRLEKAVEEAKKNREWRYEYMTLLMRDQENIEKGKIEGKIEGKLEGRAIEIVESGYEFGLSEEAILERLQKKLKISLPAAEDYLRMYGRQTV